MDLMNAGMCDGLREGAWWGGWLQHGLQSLKDRVSIGNYRLIFIVLQWCSPFCTGHSCY